MSGIGKIGGNDTTSLIDQNGNTSIKQNLNVSGFETFQSKVAGKSLCRSAIGAITGAAGGAGAVAGGIFSIKLGIDVAFGALVWLVDIVMLPVGLAGVEIL